MTDHKFAHKKNSVKKFKLQMYRNEGCSGFTLTHPELQLAYVHLIL